MTTRRHRAAAALALAAALVAVPVGAASAAPKPKPVAGPAAHSAAATTVPAQVQLHVTPVEGAAGQVVATVVVKAPGNAAVVGDYQLLDGGVVVASGALTGGTAQVALTLTEGTHTLVAAYSGAAKTNGAGTKVVTVAPAPVTPEPVTEPSPEPVTEPAPEPVAGA